jgi:hypothetical protein
MSNSTSSYADQGRLRSVSDALCLRLEELFDDLGVKLRRSGNTWSGPCPVHGGDNQGALNLYEDGHTAPGYWRCYTHGCQRVFRSTALGFLRGVLSHQRNSWEKEGDSTVGWRETVDYACAFLGTTIAAVQVDDCGAEKVGFARSLTALNGPVALRKKGLSREEVRQRLTFPAQCLLRKGFDEGVLDTFDVGECYEKGRPFFERAVAPHYENERAVWFTARSIYEKCPDCKLYHGGKCPPKEYAGLYTKWRNSGEGREALLYNWERALPVIQKTGVVVLCEGPPNAWRAAEAGIENVVCQLGSALTDQQQILLETSGATTVVVATDMDEVGRQAAALTKLKLGRIFRVVVPELPAKDLGDMAADAVQGLLQPIMDKYGRKS